MRQRILVGLFSAAVVAATMFQGQIVDAGHRWVMVDPGYGVPVHGGIYRGHRHVRGDSCDSAASACDSTATVMKVKVKRVRVHHYADACDSSAAASCDHSSALPPAKPTQLPYPPTGAPAPPEVNPLVR